MKVLVVSHLYPCPSEPSKGVFVHRQLKALRDRGVDIRVVSPTPYVPPVVPLRDEWRRYRSAPASDTRDGVPVRYVRYLSLPTARSRSVNALSLRATLSRLVARYLDDVSWEPDLLVAHGITPDGYACVRLAEDLEVPLVVTAHGYDVRALEGIRVLKSQAAETFRRASVAVFNSRKLLDKARNCLRLDTETTVVPNGFPSRLVERAEPTELPDGFDETRPTIVTVGTVVEDKGHPSILNALERMDKSIQPNWLVVGDGPDRETLEAAVADTPFADSVAFTGEVSHEDVFRHLKAGDVMVLPSSPEAFGTVYVEAMACGIPVVGCRGEGPEEIVDVGSTGLLVPPNDPSVLQDRIKSLVGDEWLLRSMGERARSVAWNLYTWDAIAERLQSVYRACHARRDTSV